MVPSNIQISFYAVEESNTMIHNYFGRIMLNKNSETMTLSVNDTVQKFVVNSKIFFFPYKRHCFFTFELQLISPHFIQLRPCCCHLLAILPINFTFSFLYCYCHLLAQEDTITNYSFSNRNP